MKRIVLFFVLLLSLAACDLLPGPIFPEDRPSVDSVLPDDGATNVPIGTSVVAQLDLPNGDLDVVSVTDSSVRLTPEGSSSPVEARVSVSNESETLTLQPLEPLEYDTTYTFEITSAVEDESGAEFERWESIFTTVSDDVPAVIGSFPPDGSTDVPLDLNGGVSTELNLPNGGVDPDTLTPDNVYLTNLDTSDRVPGNINSTGGYDSIAFVPNDELEPNTRYRFDITSDVQDQAGVPFLPFSMTFTTGTRGGVDSDFSIERQEVAARELHTALAFGPDGDLYALTFDGRILRYPVGSDGSLGTPQTFTSLQEAENGRRLAIGLAFGPSATESNPVLWVSHTAFGVEGVDEPWSGKITRISGPNLENVQDYVVGLPRSFKDHVTNKIEFNPDEPNVLYFLQGSNTAMGAPDAAWGYQPERLLSGSLLRVDVSQITSPPLNVQTEDGGSYNPFAPGAPLTIYARGIRNAYDLVWHSNGNLYVPANGSAAGGNIPRYDASEGDCSTRPDGGYSGPVLDDPSDVNAEYLSDRTDGWKINKSQHDFLFKVEEDGYYGHPNPKRCEWIMNGGNPTGSNDGPNEVDAYPAGTQPDPNYRGFAYDFGLGVSPNGVIEYQSSGEHQGKLLVVRYSRYDDILAVELDSSGNVIGESPIVESGSFTDPLDLVEDPDTGYLYVTELPQIIENTSKAGISLLRPTNN